MGSDVTARARMTGRCIDLAAFVGSQNMAIDQALSESPLTAPTLRFYQWSEPTLSLGYFQRLVDRQHHFASSELSLVRRSTGGGAIVHHHELTYSLVLSPENQRCLFERSTATGACMESYAAVHHSVIETLREFGVAAELFAGDSRNSVCEPLSEPFLCFQRRSSWDVIVGGYKILGSAQRRVRGALLQHGSVLMRSSPHAPQLPGILDLSSRSLDAEQLSRAVRDSLATRMRITWKSSDLTVDEKRLAGEIQTSRFDYSHWTQRR